jgi:hypothetical protein
MGDTTVAYRKIDDIVKQMDQRLKELAEAGDRRQIFLTVYRAMTQQMRAALPAGRFLDPEWTLSLTVRFAGMYFEADEAYCSDDASECPAPWERAFAMSSSSWLLVIEHALLGINAHITYDLPRAVAATMREFGDTATWPDGAPNAAVLARRRYDYEVVNEILAQTTDGVQDVLGRRFSPFMRVIDAMALRIDEAIAEALLRYTRTQGWNHAVALAFARTPQEEALIKEHLAAVAIGVVRRIDLLNHLPGPLRRGMGRLRQPIVPAVGRISAPLTRPVTAARRRRARSR